MQANIDKSESFLQLSQAWLMKRAGGKKSKTLGKQWLRAKYMDHHQGPTTVSLSKRSFPGMHLPQDTIIWCRHVVTVGVTFVELGE